MQILQRWAFVSCLVLLCAGCGSATRPATDDAGGRSALAFKSDVCIVKDGVPNAVIVISENPARPRMVNLAALELQYYIEKMSGARLPIMNEPGTTHPVKIYVGRSVYTEDLGVTGGDLKFGAFRMEAGDNWLVLLGDDFDFTPPEPWNTANGDIPRARQEWDQVVGDRTDSAWGYAFNLLYKKFWNPRGFDDFIAERYGEDNVSVWNPRGLNWSREYQGAGGGQGFWEQDAGGSLNAVYALLRALGVRWYLPEEIGEVVPELKTVFLPDVSKTERPDYQLRTWLWYNYAGMNSAYETMGYASHAHGLARVHARKEMQEAHPDYYALLRDGKRDTEFRGTGHVCFSSEGFQRETINYARFMFDHYDEPLVSLWPQDGFHKCGCDACRQLSPSDLVWGFIDRVARELYQTHPDRLVTCGAYTPYIYPPDNVEKFTPNVAVWIANCGRPLMDDPVRWKAYWDRVEGWRAKVAPGNILRVENNRYGLGRKFPVIHPRNMARDLRALKGISRGERCEMAQSGGRWHSPGLDHLTLYTQARFLWDADQDVDALLDEYHRLFYGPAHAEMQAAFEFAEAIYSRSDVNDKRRCDPRNVPLPDRIRFMEMLQKARERAGDTIYGQRIQLIMDELPPLDTLRQELVEREKAGDPRAEAPVVTARHVSAAAAAEPQTFIPSYGARYKDEVPQIPTTFSVQWEAGALLFDILCHEPDMQNLQVAADVWEGDSVVLVLESPSHSYYQIEINPDGKVYDADRAGGGRVITRWASMAEARTEHGADYWRVTLRLPVAIVGREGAEGDPMNYVIAPELDSGAAWYFNLARRRKRPGLENQNYRDITAV
ncbi:MAG: DUF4838 domain-containing protein, partial [Lentisphaerae bacterium]|nr:DUF4838 domain-containing protein [Lentisphaerota bacterium]